MYRHLLVPLDDSALAVETVTRAVELAKALTARITFFHAQADYGATSLGALERVIAPAAFNDGVAGIARGILAKAEVAARQAGVESASVTVTSDRIPEAILDVAAANGCDLIFMASHGPRGLRGLVVGSQTQRVLQNTTLPVLVSSVESNAAESHSGAALAIICDEHRSLSAVLQALEHLVARMRRGDHPRFELLRAVLHYIREFPERLHHPKEEAYLFARLRSRTPAFNATLDELERQHAANAEALVQMEAALRRFENDPAYGLAHFASAVERFTRLQWPHMSLESRVIFPAARAHLTAEDWAQIAAAFEGNADPRFCMENDDEFRRLFARILNLVPQGAASVSQAG
ncbi:MAG TPA: universal stress protein [Usitatibacter sp.]|jgi:hemerythrin-like domain-containing protein/nucleotide-binding universal stress UspA family protein|nr:universal stress protein [Usitatibacter sp.]